MIAACMAAGVACNLLNGVGDLTTTDEGEEASVIVRGDAELHDAGQADAPVPPPTCACVNAPPADWLGPFALLEGSGTTGSTACPTGLTSVLDGGAEPSSAQPCTACTCGSPAGSCATVHVQTFGGGGCTNDCSNGLAVLTTTCGAVKYCNASSSATAVGDIDSGTCAPDGGRIVAPSWGKTAAACAFAAPPDTVCPANQACAPKSAGAPDARTCILHAGAVECPAGPYSKRVTYDTKLVDTRSCGACTCDAPIGNCSAGTISLYIDTSCGNQTKDVPTSGVCTNFNDPAPNGSGKIITQPQFLDGGCAPHGGQLADGGLIGTDPSTLCCL